MRAQADGRRTVVQVTYSLVTGGSERFAYLAARHTAPHRFRHVVCAVDAGGSMEPALREAHIPYDVLGRREGGIDWRLIWRMVRYLRSQRAAAVHTHHLTQLLYAGLAARLVGARLIHTEHSVEQLGSARLRTVLRVLARLCHRVTAVGEDGLAVLRDRVGVPDSKLEVVRAGIDVEAFSYPRARARTELGVPASAKVAAIVARISKEKNHALLIEAFVSVVARTPGAVLLVAGEGPEAPGLATAVREAGLTDAVRLLGVRTDVHRVLAASDVFVLCSDREGLPIAILEAMAAGLPVVATAVGDVPTVVREGETGYLSPPRDAERLASALLRAFEAEGDRERMGQAGRSLVASQFSLGAMATRLEQLYGGAA